MKNKLFFPILAIFSGVLLTLMIMSNSYLSTFTSPIKASWYTHAVGTLFSILIYVIFSKKIQKKTGKTKLMGYLAGIPGAFTVLLAAITVNSNLSLSGSIILMLVGQIVFSLFVDYFGILGIQKKKITRKDVLMSGFLILGGFLVILGK